MGRIRPSNTTPERVVRAAVEELGAAVDRNVSWLPGRPDIVLPKQRLVIFVHGCFWHRHGARRCPLTRMPKSRVEFWRRKFESNVRRDAAQRRKLRRAGWSVLTVWECELRGAGKFRYDPVKAAKLRGRLMRALKETK